MAQESVPARKVLVKCAGKCGQYVQAEWRPDTCRWIDGDLPIAFCPECQEAAAEREALAYLTLPS